MHFILCSTQYLARSIQYLVCCCSNVKQAFQPNVYLSDLKVKPSHFKRRLTLLFSTCTLHTVWGKAVKCLSRCLPPTPTPPVLQGGVRVQWDSTPLEYIFVRLQSKQLKFRKEFLKRIYEKTSTRDPEMSSTLRDLKQSRPTTGPCTEQTLSDRLQNECAQWWNTGAKTASLQKDKFKGLPKESKDTTTRRKKENVRITLYCFSQKEIGKKYNCTQGGIFLNAGKCEMKNSPQQWRSG